MSFLESWNALWMGWKGGKHRVEKFSEPGSSRSRSITLAGEGRRDKEEWFPLGICGRVLFLSHNRGFCAAATPEARGVYDCVLKNSRLVLVTFCQRRWKSGARGRKYRTPMCCIACSRPAHLRLGSLGRLQSPLARPRLPSRSGSPPPPCLAAPPPEGCLARQPRPVRLAVGACSPLRRAATRSALRSRRSS